MPTYLVHGFRWHRAAIRIHIILFNLADAAAEWIIGPASAFTITNSFHTLYDFLPPPPKIPDAPLADTPAEESTHEVLKNDIQAPQRISHSHTPSSSSTSNPDATLRTVEQKISFNEWSPIKLLEQYDPDDLSVCSQPYAYVADHIVPIPLSCNIQFEIDQYEEARPKNGPQPGPNCAPPNPQPPKAPLDASVSESPSTPSSPAASIKNLLSDTRPEADLIAPEAGLGEAPTKENTKPKETGNKPWIELLKDRLQPDENIGWYIVVCGDEERSAGLDDTSIGSEAEYDDEAAEEAADDGVRDPRALGTDGETLTAKTETNPVVVEKNPERNTLKKSETHKSKPELKSPKTSKEGGLKRMRSFFGRKK